MEQTTKQLAVTQQQEFPLAVFKKDELYVKSSQQNKVEITKTIEEAFTGFEEIEKQVKAIEVKGIDDKMNIELADTYRKNIKQTRLKYEKVFDAKRQEIKDLKSEYDLQDKMWLKAKQLIGEKFKAVEEIAKFKADFVERFQAEQKALRTQKRINEVQKYIEPDCSVFENMNDTNFGFYLQRLKAEHEKQIAAEQKAEAERMAKEKADAEERERVKIENEKLKAQVEAEREAKAKLEAELKAKQYAELKAEKEAQIKAKLEREAAEQKAQKPAEEQLLDWIDSFELPALELESLHKEYIIKKFEYFKNWAKAQAKKDDDSLSEYMLQDANRLVQSGIKKAESDNRKQENETLLDKVRACKTMTELESLRNKTMEQKTTETTQEIGKKYWFISYDGAITEAEIISVNDEGVILWKRRAITNFSNDTYKIIDEESSLTTTSKYTLEEFAKFHSKYSDDFDIAIQFSKELFEKVINPNGIYKVAQDFDNVFEKYVSEPVSKAHAKIRKTELEAKKRHLVSYRLVAVNELTE